MKAKVDGAPAAWFTRELASAEGTPEYALEWLLLDVEDAIHAAMDRRGVTRSELAQRLGTSRAFVTKLLGGHENMTLRTLARVASALDVRVDLRLRDRAPAPPRRRPARPRSAIGGRNKIAGRSRRGSATPAAR